MELRHLRYFVAVAEELNFTRAAERLGIKQPPLSLQIRQLEKEMGTPLFRRRTRGVELTDAGKLLLEEARIILKQVETAKTGVSRRARGETGQIIIGSAAGTYFHPLIPTIIREHRLMYPEILVAPQASHTALLIARLCAGLADVCFIWRPTSHSNNLTIEPLVEEDTLIALPSGHRLSNSASVPLVALANEALILFPRMLHPDAYDLILAAFHRAGLTIVFGQEAPEIVSVIPLVAAGLGVAIVPRAISRILVDGVRYLPIEGDAPRLQISLAYRRHERSAVVQNFVAVARRLTQTAIDGKR